MFALSDVVEFLLELLRDPAAQAAFEADPDGVLADRGLDGLTAQDVRDARLVLADDGDARVENSDPPPGGDDPIREIHHTTSSYVADPAPAVTIDDRDTFVFQNSFNSDDDVTVIDDSFTSDDDSLSVDNSVTETDVVAINESFNEDNETDVVAINESFTSDDDTVVLDDPFDEPEPDAEAAVPVDTAEPEPDLEPEPEPAPDAESPDAEFLDVAVV